MWLVATIWDSTENISFIQKVLWDTTQLDTMLDISIQKQVRYCPDSQGTSSLMKSALGRSRLKTYVTGESPWNVEKLLMYWISIEDLFLKDPKT